MIRVQYYSKLQKLVGIKEDEMRVSRVSEVIREIGKRYGKEAAREAERSFIMVNGQNAALIKGYQTQLKSGDVVKIIPLSGGG